METAKIFSEGETQLVELPKTFQFNSKEVFISKIGDAIVLLPKGKTLSGILVALDMFTEDFMSDGRQEPFPKTRSSSL